MHGKMLDVNLLDISIEIQRLVEMKEQTEKEIRTCRKMEILYKGNESIMNEVLLDRIAYEAALKSFKRQLSHLYQLHKNVYSSQKNHHSIDLALSEPRLPEV